jgi:hypothetical protein
MALSKMAVSFGTGRGKYFWIRLVLFCVRFTVRFCVGFLAQMGVCNLFSDYKFLICLHKQLESGSEG